MHLHLHMCTGWTFAGGPTREGGRGRAEQTEHHDYIHNVPGARGAMRAPKALDEVVHRGVLLFQCSHVGLDVECAFSVQVVAIGYSTERLPLDVLVLLLLPPG